jgi:hypothetical protein
MDQALKDCGAPVIQLLQLSSPKILSRLGTACIWMDELQPKLKNVKQIPFPYYLTHFNLRIADAANKTVNSN